MDSERFILSPWLASSSVADVHPWHFFHHCPRCGAARPAEHSGNPFRCGSCGFLYYFNPAVASAGFILREDGKALFVVRAKDPAKGMLGLPGGFVDIGETAEDGLQREVLEEVGLKLADFSFLTSEVNSYLYQDVTYPVVDLFFVCKAIETETAEALDGVESFRWLDPFKVNPEEIAFPSMRAALKRFQSRTK